VNSRWTFPEPQKLPNPWLVLLVVGDELRRQLPSLGRLLAVNEADRKPLRVRERDRVSAARRIGQLLNLSRALDRRGLFEVRVALDLVRPAEELFGPLLRVVHVLIRPVTAIPPPVVGRLDQVHSKVGEEGRDLVEVRVLVPHVAQLDEADLLGRVDIVGLSPLVYRLCVLAQGVDIGHGCALVGLDLVFASRVRVSIMLYAEEICEVEEVS